MLHLRLNVQTNKRHRAHQQAMTQTLETEFKKIIDEHKSTIYSVCYMYSKDPDEVNDLFQETLVKVWQGLPSFKGKSSVKTWIWRITLNTCISAERKKKMKTVPLTMDINLFEDNDANTRQVNMLKERISKLRYFDRAIVLLWLENMSYDEIAAVVGITSKQVSVRLFRIKEQLKQMNNN